MKRIYVTAPFSKAGNAQLETRVAVISDGRVIGLSIPVSLPLICGISSVEIIPIDCYFSSKIDEDQTTLVRFGLI